MARKISRADKMPTRRLVPSRIGIAWIRSLGEVIGVWRNSLCAMMVQASLTMLSEERVRTGDVIRSRAKRAGFACWS